MIKTIKTLKTKGSQVQKKKEELDILKQTVKNGMRAQKWHTREAKAVRARLLKEAKRLKARHEKLAKKSKALNIKNAARVEKAKSALDKAKKSKNPAVPKYGYKKVLGKKQNSRYVLKLELYPDSPVRCHTDYRTNRVALDSKMRTDKVKVVKAWKVISSHYKKNRWIPERLGKEVKNKKTLFRSFHDHSFKYELGKVKTAKFTDADSACSGGIHFFLKRSSAVGY